MRTKSRWPVGPAALLALCAALILAGCGTQGYAAALGQPAHATLTGAYAGTASFTPTYATYYATYYEGRLVPYIGAKTPVELRTDNCAGPLIANLTQAHDDLPAASPAPPFVQQDPTQPGVDVAVTASANLWITVRAKPNDPNADILACGQPLSDRKQTFDIYPPSVGSDGTALGFTLQAPIVATRLSLAFTRPLADAVAWSVRAGSCAGSVIASGVAAKGATQANAFIFRTLDSSHWRLTLAPLGSTPTGAAPGGIGCYSLA